MIELMLSLLLGLGVPSIRAQQASPVPSLDGHEEGGVYTNGFFQFTFKFPTGWKRVPESAQAAIIKDLNAKASKSDNRALVMLWRPVHGEPMPDVIAIFSALYSGPGRDGAAGGVAYFEGQPPHDSEIVTPISIVELGGQQLATQIVRLPGQADFMAEFVSVKSGHLLNLQVHAATEDRLNAAVKVLSASVQFQKVG